MNHTTQFTNFCNWKIWMLTNIHWSREQLRHFHMKKCIRAGILNWNSDLREKKSLFTFTFLLEVDSSPILTDVPLLLGPMDCSCQPSQTTSYVPPLTYLFLRHNMRRGHWPLNLLWGNMASSYAHFGHTHTWMTFQDLKGILRDFGNEALCLLPQSQMKLWTPFFNVSVSNMKEVRGSICEPLLTSVSTMTGSLWVSASMTSSHCTNATKQLP